MKRIAHFISAVAVALALPSCLQSETTIHLNKDGSGTVVEQTTLGAQMLEMLDQFAGLGGDSAPKDPVADMFTAEKAKLQAAKMGEGVTFVSTEPVKNAAGGRGAKVTYKFADINKLKLAPGSGMKNASPMGPEQEESGPKPKPIGFAFAGGTLTVTMPEPDKAAADTPKPEGGPDMDSPEAMAKMKEIMGDMKMSLRIVADGGVAETDASYHEGNTVTLVEMNMGKVLENPEAFKKMNAAGKDDPQAALEALKGVEGVKMEVKKQITIKLK